MRCVSRWKTWANRVRFLRRFLRPCLQIVTFPECCHMTSSAASPRVFANSLPDWDFSRRASQRMTSSAVSPKVFATVPPNCGFSMAVLRCFSDGFFDFTHPNLYFSRFVFLLFRPSSFCVFLHTYTSICLCAYWCILAFIYYHYSVLGQLPMPRARCLKWYEREKEENMTITNESRTRSNGSPQSATNNKKQNKLRWWHADGFEPVGLGSPPLARRSTGRQPP